MRKYYPFFAPKELTTTWSPQNSVAKSKSFFVFFPMGLSIQSSILRFTRLLGLTYFPATRGCPYPTAHSLNIPCMGILKPTLSGTPQSWAMVNVCCCGVSTRFFLFSFRFYKCGFGWFCLY